MASTARWPRSNATPGTTRLRSGARACWPPSRTTTAAGHCALASWQGRVRRQEAGHDWVGSPELGLQLLQGAERLCSTDALWGSTDAFGEEALAEARRRVLARLRRVSSVGAAARSWGAWRRRRYTAWARTCTHGARLDCGLSNDACLHGEVWPGAGKGMCRLRVEGDANNRQTRKKDRRSSPG